MAQLKKATNSVSQEDTEDPKFRLATGGLYRHPASGQELAVFDDPITGNAQAQGLLRVGFEYVGEVPKGYDKTVVVNHDFASEASKGPVVASEDMVKGLLARVRELEDKKNADEAAEAKKDDKSGDAADVLNTEEIHARAEAKVADRDNLDSAGVNTPTNVFVETGEPVTENKEAADKNQGSKKAK